MSEIRYFPGNMTRVDEMGDLDSRLRGSGGKGERVTLNTRMFHGMTLNCFC